MGILDIQDLQMVGLQLKENEYFTPIWSCGPR